MIRTLVVEDAPLARDALVRLLGAHRDIDVVGTAASATEGLRRAADLAPELIFLDIQLPDLDGIELARRLPLPRPAIVFLTAFPQHALPAFEVEALDYLLKPASVEGLTRALDRVRRALGRLSPAVASPAHLEIRDGSRRLFVPLTAIDHVDAAGHYLCIHAEREVHLLRLPMAELVERLGPAFVRTETEPGAESAEFDRAPASGPVSAAAVAVAVVAAIAVPIPNASAIAPTRPMGFRYRPEVDTGAMIPPICEAHL